MSIAPALCLAALLSVWTCSAFPMGFQDGFQDGSQDGFQNGFQDGFQDVHNYPMNNFRSVEHSMPFRDSSIPPQGVYPFSVTTPSRRAMTNSFTLQQTQCYIMNPSGWYTYRYIQYTCHSSQCTFAYSNSAGGGSILTDMTYVNMNNGQTKTRDWGKNRQNVASVYCAIAGTVSGKVTG